MKKMIGLFVCLFLIGSQIVNAQSKQISGTVTSAEDGMGMPGVSVVIKGTTIGASTDIDGKYSLEAQASDVLMFSFVGTVTQEITVGDQTVINVVLESESIGVDEVIVTGYTAHRKSEVTGSTVQVKGEDLADMPVVSVDQALQGRVAGVAVSGASGTPGSAQKIRIRGRSSITAGNNPLYVIDGVPMVDGNVSTSSATSSLSMLATLNSNDIESISILKDASATAAYGARGANGVVVITTKSGKSGKANINFSATYGVSNDAVDGPGVLTGAEREELFLESLINSFGGDYGFSDQDGAREFYNNNTGYFWSDYANWNAAGRPETDWADLITNKNAPMQEYNLSATGGKDGISYYISGGYLKQEATVIGAEYERISGTVNLDVDLSPNFKFSTKNTGSHSYQDGLLEGSAYFSSPRSAKFFMPSITQAYNEDGTPNLNTDLPNPLYIAEQDIDENKLTRILTNNSLTWKTPIENLTFTTRMNIDYQVYHYKTYDNPVSGDGDGATRGYGYQTNRNRANYVFQNMLDYTLALDGGHDFDFKVVQEFQKNRLYFLAAEADNFSDVGLTNLNSAGNPTTANSWFTDWSVASYLGMIHYSFNGKYVADVTYRREGSSRFSADNRWGNFWAVGGAWNINREDFMANIDQIDMLKLRASYGKTGNANINLNQYQELLNFDADYTGEGASYAGTFGNQDLTWETSYSLDLGLDFGLFNNRISGSVGYYFRETTDMLLNEPLSLTTGFTSQTRNIGKMENKGWEFELNADIVRSNDLNVSLGLNVGTTKNKVTELAVDNNGVERNITDNTTRVATGHPVYGWYMPTWAGVDPDTGNELWFVDGEGSETTSNFNAANQVWQGGSAIPEVTAGLNLHVDYKGFFLDASAYFAGGHKVYEEWHRYTNGTDRFSLQFYQGVDKLLDRWQKPGDTGTRYGKMEYTARPWQRHSKFLYDGDYIRLKDLSVGYDFNKNITDAMGIGGLRVYVRGTNLLTWVKDDNLEYDPEVDTDGFTGLTTPPAKSFIFGVNLKF
ncbi:SusC/RagA family TonB-linked outer membrane protein [Marinifilum flexuosum]|uniref:TonB-linked SusC/RagA family outer membrane protein n=1 Tax=Marinifilum flexuosum TaxID=1117708 RepID=A0A419X909_9BACT|nr:TonB-dependent receptor [Marinifilum flexuosum]RKE04238.1 TonB-linked SusC/RagA family outer membrane protein [Marinifilum flexuosum]